MWRGREKGIEPFRNRLVLGTTVACLRATLVMDRRRASPSVRHRAQQRANFAVGKGGEEEQLTNGALMPHAPECILTHKWNTMRTR